MSRPNLRNKMVPVALQSYVLLASPPPVTLPPPRGGHCLTFGTLIPFNILMHIDYQYIIYSCINFL